MILQKALNHYFSHLKTALSFGLLLVFVVFFGFFSNIFVGSGSLFLEYNVGFYSIPILLFELLVMALFLLFYSFFISVIIFSVREHLSKLKLHYYLREMIHRLVSRLFVFFLLFSLVLFALGALLLYLGIGVEITAAIMLVVSLLFMFVPQSVVIDEQGLRYAIMNNFEFIAKNFPSFIKVIVLGTLLLAIVLLVEFAIDSVFLVGSYVSLILIVLFVLPFIESVKSFLYMFKFELVKHPENIARKKQSKPVMPAGLTRA